jgi:hypothetical protein
MTDKSLKSKAISIQGKKYVLVSDRVSYFNETYPNGMIQTHIISNSDGKVVIQAMVTPDVAVAERYFIGHSQADEKQGMVNKTAAIENCETSAVGRALALMGIGVIDSIASVDELKKAQVGDNVYEDISKPADHPDNEFNKSKCQKCGAPIAISKSGNPYCTAKCWLKEGK